MNGIITDNSRNVDFVIRRGASLNKTISVINSDGTPFSFVNWSAKIEVYKSIGDTIPNLVFNSSDGLQLSNGLITISKTVDQLKGFRDNGYVYFMWMTNPLGKVSLWLNGKFIVNEGLFDNNVGGVDYVSLNTLAIYTEGSIFQIKL